MKKFKGVRWEVQILLDSRDVFKRPHYQTEILSVTPHHQMDVFNYKKMVALFNQVKEENTNAAIWLVSINKEWNRKNIRFAEV